MIDIVLATTFGRLRDRFAGLAFSTNPKYATATSNNFADSLHRPIHHRYGLLKIEDMYALSNTKDVFVHLRIPASGNVTKMNARFKHLAHGKSRQSHIFFPFPVRPPRTLFQTFETPERYIGEFAPRPLSPCVDLSACFRRFCQRLQE